MTRPYVMLWGCGGAMMAWRLAIGRVPHASRNVRYTHSRATVERTPPGCFPVHREYYDIVREAESSVGVPMVRL